MQYQLIPDCPDSVIWVDETGASGVSQRGDERWPEYEAWCEAGHAAISVLPPLTLDTAMLMIDAEFERAISPISGSYPRSEIDSWPVQCAEASAYQADPETPTPMIDGILLPWEDKATFCERVLSKSAHYAATVGAVIMWRRIAVAAVEAYYQAGKPITVLTVQYPEVPNAS